MIQFYHIYKKYEDGNNVLNDLTVQIAKGEFVILTGPSGAGKTTFLKLIYKEESPTSGQIIVANYNLGDIKKSKIPYLRRKISVIFQDFKLLNDRNVFENVAIALKIRGMNSKDIKRKTLNVLSQVGLSHRIYNYPIQLSGGEQQRVAIARAMVTSPLILLADEPTASIDSDASTDILKLIKSMNVSGTTVVMATHNTELVEQLPYRVLHLNNGVIIEK